MSPRASRLRFVSASSLACLGLTALLSGACDKGPPGRGEGKTAPAANAATTPATPATSTAAPPTAAASPAGTSYGAGVKLAESTAMADILKDPAAYQGKTVRIEGMISDVCPKRGCWMELAGDVPGQKLRFKVEDGDMVFPLEAKGQYAVAEGVVAVNELSLEASREYAEYQAKEYGKPYDPASITAPTRIVRLDGTGAVVRDHK